MFLPVLVACAHSPTDCSHFNVTVVADESASLPHQPLGPHVSLEYSSSIVDSQYIVTFTSYYTTDARDGFISAALRPFHNWTILPRTNPSADYPSDFSLIKLGTSQQSEALTLLTQHPAIKQVTPEKMLTRILSSGGGK